jgi:exodeoxyribonuclease VII large subunit
LPIALFRLEHQRVQRALAEYPDFRLADGLEVRVRGRVQYGYGRVSLVMSAIDPVHTLGKLAADRQRVLRTLAAEGLLDANRSLAVPLLPLRVGLVTSAGSAAYEDTVHELRASGFGFQLLVADARVQGNGAELSMVRALHALQSRGCDLVLLVRGGGSRTDLVAFDGERLARAVAAMPVPVFTGVGHEIDTAVVDEVAHSSFKTPTACAAAVADRVRATVARSEHAWAAIASSADGRVRRAHQELDRLAVRVRVDGALRGAERLLDEHRRRVSRAAVAAVHAQQARVDILSTRIGAADPARLLSRGWSVTRTADGRLVRSPDDAPPGTELITTLGAGSLRSEVIDD